MQPVVIVGAAWLLFALTHLGLSASGLRAWMQPRYGALSFTLLYSAVTVVTLSLLGVALAVVGDTGRDAWTVAHPLFRLALAATAGLGLFLVTLGLVTYPVSRIAVLAQRDATSARQPQVPAPSALASVVRHPFFAGLVLLGLSHAFLVSTLAQSVFYVGLAVMAAAGMRMQDVKLQRRWPGLYPVSADERVAWTARDVMLLVACAMATIMLFFLPHALWSRASGAGFVVLTLLYGTTGVALGMVRRLRARNSAGHGTTVDDR